MLSLKSTWHTNYAKFYIATREITKYNCDNNKVSNLCMNCNRSFQQLSWLNQKHTIHSIASKMQMVFLKLQDTSKRTQVVFQRRVKNINATSQYITADKLNHSKMYPLSQTRLFTKQWPVCIQVSKYQPANFVSEMT